MQVILDVHNLKDYSPSGILNIVKLINLNNFLEALLGT